EAATDLGRPCHIIGDGPSGGVSDLALIVCTPAPRSAARVERAGVMSPGAHELRSGKRRSTRPHESRHERARGHARVEAGAVHTARTCGRNAGLSVVIFSPAIDRPA